MPCMQKLFRLPTSLGVAVVIAISATLPAQALTPQRTSAAVAPASENAADTYARAMHASKAQMVELLRAGAAQQQCDWPKTIDFSDVKTLGEFRELASAGVDDARSAAKAGRYEDATNDLLAVMSLGRRIAQAPLAIAKLTEVGIVASAIEPMARYLPSMPKELARDLPAKLDALPKSATHGEMILGEYEFARHLAQQHKTPMDEKTVIAAKPFYDAVAAAGNKSPADFATAADAAVNALPPGAQSFAATVAPALKPTRVPIAKLQALESMLRTASAIVADGEPALQQSHDPFGAGPFHLHRISDSCFELSSHLTARTEPVTLRVGA